MALLMLGGYKIMRKIIDKYLDGCIIENTTAENESE